MSRTSRPSRVCAFCSISTGAHPWAALIQSEEQKSSIYLLSLPSPTRSKSFGERKIIEKKTATADIYLTRLVLNQARDSIGYVIEMHLCSASNTVRYMYDRWHMGGSASTRYLCMTHLYIEYLHFTHAPCTNQALLCLLSTSRYVFSVYQAKVNGSGTIATNRSAMAICSSTTLVAFRCSDLVHHSMGTLYMTHHVASRQYSDDKRVRNNDNHNERREHVAVDGHLKRWLAHQLVRPVTLAVTKCVELSTCA